MPILTYNAGWMLYNIFLALLALGFGYFFIISKYKFAKYLSGILWLLFLPNTIYIFTDLVHLIDQWAIVDWDIKIVLVLQYLVFQIVGFVTFAFSMYPFEKIILTWKYFRSRKILVLILFNFFIAFGMVLGRVERINSWEVFTDPVKVLRSGLHVFNSLDLFGLMLLFGILCNCFYFLVRKKVIKISDKLTQVLD